MSEQRHIAQSRGEGQDGPSMGREGAWQPQEPTRYVIRDGTLTFKPPPSQNTLHRQSSLQPGQLHLRFDHLVQQLEDEAQQQPRNRRMTEKKHDRHNTLQSAQAMKRRSPGRNLAGSLGRARRAAPGRDGGAVDRSKFATPPRKATALDEALGRSRDRQEAQLGQDDQVEPQSVSPSRVIKILFNQVSKESPFAAPRQDLDGKARNSAQGSEESIGRYQELAVDNPFDNAHNSAKGNRLEKVLQMQQHAGSGGWGQVPDATPAGRSTMEPPKRSTKRLYGGVQRYSDAHAPYNKLQEEQAEEREQVSRGSPFKGMTEFQTVIMARSTSPEKASPFSPLKGVARFQGGYREPGRDLSGSRSNSKEARRIGSPGRRGQAPTQLKRLGASGAPGEAPDRDGGPSSIQIHNFSAAQQNLNGLPDADADFARNRYRNQKTNVELADEPQEQEPPRRSPQRSPDRHNQHYRSGLAAKNWAPDGYQQLQHIDDVGAGATADLGRQRRSRSKERSRSNERLHCDCEEAAGRKSTFRKMIEANLPDDSVWHRHRPAADAQLGYALQGQNPNLYPESREAPESRIAQQLEYRAMPGSAGQPYQAFASPAAFGGPVDAISSYMQSHSGEYEPSHRYSEAPPNYAPPSNAGGPPLEAPGASPYRLYSDGVPLAAAPPTVNWPSSQAQPWNPSGHPYAGLQAMQQEALLQDSFAALSQVDSIANLQGRAAATPEMGLLERPGREAQQHPGLGITAQSTATFQPARVPRLPLEGRVADDVPRVPMISAIEQAISESLESSPMDHEPPVPAQAGRHADAFPNRKNRTQMHMYRILQEPIYGKVSNQVLKDFNKSSIEAIESKYRLTPKLLQEFNKNQDMLAAFRFNPRINDGNDDAQLGAMGGRMQPGDLARHRAAILIQKYTRGYLVRRSADGFRSLLFFLRLVEKAEAASRDLAMKSLVRAIRMAHQGIKEQKQALLNGYITYCAVKIQQTWRGHYERRYLVPFRVRLAGAAGHQKLNAMIDGWRVRRIMVLKEVKSKAQLIRDHDGARQLDQFSEEELAESRKNSVKKFIGFINSMQSNGQWIILLHSHFSPSADKVYKIPQTKEEEERMLANMSSPKRLDASRRGKQSRLRPTQVAAGARADREKRQESVHDNMLGQRAFVSIAASNRFEPNFQSSEYKAAAKEIFHRRMQYDPNKSIQETRQSQANANSQAPRGSRNTDHVADAGGASQAKAAVHDLLLNQRRAKTMRQAVSHTGNRMRPAAVGTRDRAGGIYEGGTLRSPYENKYASGASKADLPAFKVRDVDQTAKETLQRRQSYIPDLKKRKLVQATAVDSPQEFLESYKQRKDIRHQQPDRVDLNKNLSLQREDLQNLYVGQAMTKSTFTPYGKAEASPLRDQAYLKSITSQKLQESPEAKSTLLPASASSGALTNQYLNRFKKSTHAASTSALQLSSAGGLHTQSAFDRRQNNH